MSHELLSSPLCFLYFCAVFCAHKTQVIFPASINHGQYILSSQDIQICIIMYQMRWRYQSTDTSIKPLDTVHCVPVDWWYSRCTCDRCRCRALPPSPDPRHWSSLPPPRAWRGRGSRPPPCWGTPRPGTRGPASAAASAWRGCRTRPQSHPGINQQFYQSESKENCRQLCRILCWNVSHLNSSATEIILEYS